jgi:flagellar assembly protein FliH
VKILLSEIIKRVNLADETVVIGPKKTRKDEKKEEKTVEDLIESAKKQAKEILNHARQEAEKIISTADAQANKIREDAKREGYSQGLKSAQEELNSQIENMKSLVNSFDNRVDESLDDVKSSLVDLSIAMIKEILLFEEEKGEIEKKIEKALEMVKSSKKIVLKVSSDLPKNLIDKFSSIEKVQIIPLSTLKKMDVQIEADFGTLDLRVNSQIELFERLVKKAFGGEK